MTKDELLTKKVSAISLGCDKNRVDLEKMLFLLSNYGLKIIEDVEDADIVLVNTCAFILPAKQEAISSIIEMESLKEKGKIEKVIVTGCIVERHKKEMQKEFPLIDAFVPIKENHNIVNIIENLYEVKNSRCSASYDRILTTSCAYAYLKIADGCNNVCSFCTIPRIRGKYKSEKMADLVDEAKLLVKKGVKEIILVAQDTTRYGTDLYGKPMLLELLKKLTNIKGLKWIRIHYAYPEVLSDELLDYISQNPKICNYLDIPLQHIDDGILKSMRRHHDEKATRELIKKLKTKYPQIKIRSTFIVGYPGETHKAFKKLLNFLREVKLDYVGFFPYYREENTVSFYLKKQKSKLTKSIRLKKAQKVQAKVAYEQAVKQIGQKMEVLVDSFDEKTGCFTCHSEFLSPSVDFGIKIVDNGSIQTGEIYECKLVDFDGCDFKGEIL